ncbi:PAS domain S-box protein [Poriferisphaera sp. WC338]|uniref:PAS domain S-box protein n=1 Tax=Poriferisphaera sp. WC338 TaxID=3425129 RepID=UPI003D81C4F1
MFFGETQVCAQDYSSSKIEIGVGLTLEEAKWIKDHPVVRVGCAPDWPPFLYFNAHGQEVGMAREYMELIGQRTGLKFVHIYYDTWADLLKAAERQEVDVITTIAQNAARSRYLLFTDPYFDVKTIIIGTNQSPSDLKLTKLDGLKIAAVDNSALYDKLTAQYPHYNVTGVIDDKAGLEGVAFAKFDVFVTDIASASYLIDHLALTNLQIVGQTPWSYQIRIGSRRDWPILNGVLDKGLATITPAERKAVERKWIKLKDPNLILWPKLLFGFAIVIGLLIITVTFILIWNRVLQRKVTKRTYALYRELEQHKRTEAALRESEEHFRRYFELGIVGMALTDEQGRFCEVNDRLCEMLGYDPESLKNTTWVTITHPDDLQGSIEQFQNLMTKKQDGFMVDKRYIKLDGSTLYAITAVRAVRRRDGSLSHAIAMILDITERKKGELRQQTMMQELDHRVKNNLAEVLALADHTIHRSSNLDEFRESFVSRVRAMARTHEALAASRWEGIDLMALMQLVFDAYCKDENTRVHFDGKPIVLPSRTCSPLCMTLNELMVNATKHGSLSNTHGYVKVSWHMLSNKQLHIHWEEKDGPTVKVPERKGFGTKLMKGLIEYELQGRLEIAYHETGIVCDIDIQLVTDEMKNNPIH